MAYDLIVIGTGPGGYVCAIRAAQLGLKAAVVEKRATFGGTCLNIGCIPSKALLHASELFEEAGHTLRQDGHRRAGAQARSAGDDGVQGRRASTATSRASSSCSRRTRSTRFTAPAASPRPARSRSRAPTARRRRSRPNPSSSPPAPTSRGCKGIEIDEKRIVSSTGALALDKVPEHLLVVGAGVIGLELGSVWRRLGAQGDGGRIPRRHPARHGRRSAPAGAAPVREAGHDVQAVVQGHGGRRIGQAAEGDGRAGQRRRGRNDRGRCRARRPSAACLTPKGSA